MKLHPSSVMFGFKPEIVIFCHLMATQKSYIRDLSLVDPVFYLKLKNFNLKLPFMCPRNSSNIDFGIFYKFACHGKN